MESVEETATLLAIKPMIADKIVYSATALGEDIANVAVKPNGTPAILPLPIAVGFEVADNSRLSDELGRIHDIAPLLTPGAYEVYVLRQVMKTNHGSHLPLRWYSTTFSPG